MPHFPLMSMGTPFLFHNLSSHMINIRWSKFDQKSIGSFISGELP